MNIANAITWAGAQLWLASFYFAVHAATLEITPGPFRSGKAFVPAVFDGIKENCFLDTGSAMTLLTNSDAFSKQPNLGNFQFKSASKVAKEVQTIQVHTAIVDRVQFLNSKIGRVPAGEGIESSLGMDLLGRQPFSANFLQTPAVNLNPRPPRRLFLNGLESNQYHLLSLPIAFRNSETRAMWDTGSSITAVDQAFIQAHPDDFKPSRNSMKGTDGAGHELIVKSFRARKIAVGSRTFRNLKVVAVDLSLLRENVDPKIYAVIGFNLIRKADWFFDPAKKAWNIE